MLFNQVGQAAEYFGRGRTGPIPATAPFAATPFAAAARPGWSPRPTPTAPTQPPAGSVQSIPLSDLGGEPRPATDPRSALPPEAWATPPGWTPEREADALAKANTPEARATAAAIADLLDD